MFKRLKLSISTALLCLAVLACSSNESTVEGITLFKVKELVTLSEQKGNAVAIKGQRIIAVGEFDVLSRQFEKQGVTLNTEFKESVFVPGFINQHDHPWLAAITLSSNVVSFEDWVLPHRTYQKAVTEQEYKQRLSALVAEHKDKDELFLSWGYHKLWHGELTREILDEISSEIPIAIWQRSVHEFIINTKGLELFGINQTLVEGFSDLQKSQINLEDGHFWESGLLALSDSLFKHLIKPKSYINSLYMVQDYWHRAGTTLVVEPGGLVNKNLSILQNHAFADASTPFHMDYIVDGKTMALKHMDTLLESTEDIRTWGQGMSRFLPKQIKLFSDGAVFSQLMQLSEGYLDGHHGEWIMQPALFKEAFQKYWDAGYQIHVHQNGDAGLDLVLDTLAENIKRNPRVDHRTTIVHFSYSRLDQVAQIKALGAIVSVNPYYPVALSEMYSEVGMGKERAHSMVRLADLENADISYSLHSDMPMAPGQPLFLMWCAVNRISLNGNVIEPAQTISAENALKAITIDAAYSMQLENDLGSIEQGKFANLTILAENPLTVAPATIKDIKVLGTIHEGRVLKVTGLGPKKINTWQLIPVYWELLVAKINN